MHSQRVVVAALVVLALGAAPGCGSQRARSVENLDGIDVGQRVRIEGTLSLRGSTPFTTVVLETAEGAVIPIDARQPGLIGELRSFAGMRCAVEGDVLPKVDANLPQLSVTRYEVLPLPTGERPVIGIVTMEDGECVLSTGDGKRYWIRGDLAAAIKDYAGARVWVVGRAESSSAKSRPEKSTPFTPTGYGVIDEAPPR
jgi:hypothetical protein